MTKLDPLGEDERAAASHAGAQDRFLSRSVALVGFMGVGKTSVGQELARCLARPFVDTDSIVEQRSGRTIPELFAEGEPVFREFERKALIDALDLPPCVIALGGGAFSQPGAAELVLPRALVVHLHIPWRVLVGLLPALAADRPMVRDREVWQVQDLFLSRAASYRRAHLRIILPRHGPAEAAGMVAEVLSVRSQTAADPAIPLGGA